MKKSVVIPTLMLIIMLTACGNKLPPSIGVSELYDRESQSFVIRGRTAGESLEEVLNDLGTSLTEQVQAGPAQMVSENGEYTYGYPSSDGEYRLMPEEPDVTIGGIPARTACIFYHDKLIGVKYVMDFESMSESRGQKLLDKLRTELKEEYNGMEQDEWHWYSENSEGETSMLNLVIAQEGGLFAELNVYLNTRYYQPAVMRI